MEYQSHITPDGGVVYYLSGQLSAQHHHIFRTLLKEFEAGSFKSCTLNMAKLDFIDSGGLGMLLLANDVCKKRNVALSLAAPAGNVLKILTLSHFQKIMTITES